MSQSRSIEYYLNSKERADINASYHKTVALAGSIRMIEILNLADKHELILRRIDIKM